MNDPTRIVVFFDLDGTLIEGDSFVTFLACANGWPRTAFALLSAVIAMLLQRPADHRTFLKQRLLDRLLHGRKLVDLAPALQKLRAKRRLKDAVIQKMRGHKAQGHHVVIATGALTLYVPALLDDVPFDALIGVELAMRGDVVTSTMLSGNTVRQVKADAVQAYLEKHGPFADSYGYGNTPHDLPMLTLLKHQIII